MYRLSGMTTGSSPMVSGVSYNAGNQMLPGVDIAAEKSSASM
jgi:hypothetical protein